MNIVNDQKSNEVVETNFKTEIVSDTKHKKEFLIIADAVAINKAVDADIAARAKTFKLAGFKKEGGAPVSLVKRQIGRSVMSEHIDKLIQTAVMQFVNEHKLNVSGVPTIDVKEFNPEGNITIAVSIGVMAEVPTIDFTGDKFRIEMLELAISEDDIKQARDALLKMIVSYKEASEGHAAQTGDAIIIDFHGKLNGEEFEGNQASQIRIDLGEGNFIKDFEEKLVGFKKGDEGVIQVQFPEDYSEAKLANQTVEFSIKVHEILVKDQSGDIESELQKRFDVKSMDELNQMIEAKIKQDFNAISRLRTKKLLFDKIDSEVDFELPEDMIEADLQNMWKDVSAKIASGEVKRSEEDAKAELQTIAKRRVKLGLILADVARKNAINVLQEDVENAKNAEKAKRPDSSAAIDEFFAKKENIDVLQGAILEEKVVDFLLSKAQVYAISVTTSEFNDKYAKEMQDLIS